MKFYASRKDLIVNCKLEEPGSIQPWPDTTVSLKSLHLYEEAEVNNKPQSDGFGVQIHSQQDCETESLKMCNSVEHILLRKSEIRLDNQKILLLYVNIKWIFLQRRPQDFKNLTLKHTILTLRGLMSYIYGAPILDVSRSHTTTQHSR